MLFLNNKKKMQANINSCTGVNEFKPTPGFRGEIYWPMVLLMVALNLAMFYGHYLIATFQVKFASILWSIFLGYIGIVSTTVGAHRLFTHKAYKVAQPLKILLVLIFVSTGQKSLWAWVRDHRVHHKYCDTDADPHNSKRGFFYCHIGWIMFKRLPECIEKCRTIDMSDLKADPWIMFQKKYFKILYLIIGILIPVVVPVLLWNETWWSSLWVCFFARYFTTGHVILSVNSVAHYFGAKPYTKDITPVETSWISFLTTGEGWHNYHHTFPWDYRASEYGKLNHTTTIIDLCAKFGWITDLRSVSDEMIEYRIASRGDGSHPLSKTVITSIQPDMEFEPEDIFGNKFTKLPDISNKTD